MESVGIIGVLIGFVLVVWGILGFCIPFMVYGIWQAAKQTNRELQALRNDQRRQARKLFELMEGE